MYSAVTISDGRYFHIFCAITLGKLSNSCKNKQYSGHIISRLQLGRYKDVLHMECNTDQNGHWYRTNVIVNCEVCKQAYYPLKWSVQWRFLCIRRPRSVLFINPNWANLPKNYFCIRFCRSSGGCMVRSIKQVWLTKCVHFLEASCDFQGFAHRWFTRDAKVIK